MKRNHWNMILFLSSLSMLYAIVARLSDSTTSVQTATANRGAALDRAEKDWSFRVAVMLARHPEHDPRPINIPTDWHRPVLREREALLPDPPTGQELIDRVFARQEADAAKFGSDRRASRSCECGADLS
jgi:hypothetical protein